MGNRTGPEIWKGYWKNQMLLIEMCVCVCERERERGTARSSGLVGSERRAWPIAERESLCSCNWSSSWFSRTLSSSLPIATTKFNHVTTHTTIRYPTNYIYGLKQIFSFYILPPVSVSRKKKKLIHTN